MNDQGDSQDFRKDRIGVSPASLLAERIAMVAGQHNDAVIVQTLRFQEADEFAETGIHSLDAGRIGFIESVVRAGSDRFGSFALNH